MIDSLTERLSQSGSTMRNLGMDQRKVSPEMQAAIDRGRAAIKGASQSDVKAGGKRHALKLKSRKAAKRT